MNSRQRFPHRLQFHEHEYDIDIIIFYFIIDLYDQTETEMLSDSKGFSKIIVYRVKHEHQILVCDTGCRSERQT